MELEKCAGEVCAIREWCKRYVMPPSGSTQQWTRPMHQGYDCEAFVQAEGVTAEDAAISH